MFNKCSVCICIRFLPPSIPHLLCSYLEGTFLLSLDLGIENIFIFDLIVSLIFLIHR